MSARSINTKSPLAPHSNYYELRTENQSIQNMTNCQKHLHAARLGLVLTATSIAAFAVAFYLKMIYVLMCCPRNISKDQPRLIYQISQQNMRAAKHSFYTFFSLKGLDHTEYNRAFSATYGQKKLFGANPLKDLCEEAFAGKQNGSSRASPNFIMA